MPTGQTEADNYLDLLIFIVTYIYMALVTGEADFLVDLTKMSLY